MAASVWKGYIAFGLITIPVRLLRAARSERVPLLELRPTNEIEDGEEVPAAAPAAKTVRIDSGKSVASAAPPPTPAAQYEPVRRIATGANSETPAPAGSITKGYEYQRGRYVTLAPDELRSITPKTSPDMEITEFVRLADIDPIYYETSYYVKPEEAGKKPYALLYEAMRESGLAGLAQVAMHRRDRVVIVRPGAVGLMAHAMYFAREVRSAEEFRADLSLVTEKEIALAKLLVETLAGPFEPAKYEDKYRGRLEALIAAKVEGRQTVSAASTPAAKPASDIMEALRKSLEAVRKPAARIVVTKGAPAKKIGSR